MSDSGFEGMMSAHHGEIYRYLLRMTRRASDADDLSQDTFLRAYRAHRALAPDANVRAWLFAIATNLWKNHVRGQSRRRRAYQAVALEDRHVDRATPDRSALSRETGALLEAALATLPLRQRVAFVQRKIHGLEYEAIGSSLQCSAETARAHVFQALKKLRRHLEAPADERKESRSCPG